MVLRAQFLFAAAVRPFTSFWFLTGIVAPRARAKHIVCTCKTFLARAEMCLLVQKCVCARKNSFARATLFLHVQKKQWHVQLDFDFGMPDPHSMDSTFFNT